MLGTNLRHLLVDTAHLVEETGLLQTHGMTLMDEFLLCLEILIVKLVSLMLVSHRRIDLSYSPIGIDEFTLHSLFPSDCLHLIQAGKSLIIAFHGGEYNSPLQFGLDNALQAVGGDLLSLELHLVVVFQRLSILS